MREELDRIERVLTKVKNDDQHPPDVRYAAYILMHKWCVGKAIRVEGLSLWRALIHDWQKFTPTEWKPYVDNFYRSPPPRREDGGYDPAAVGNGFSVAWLHHVHHGPHHWQHWVLRGEGDSETILEMPEVYVREMVCDWRGAGRAIAGTWDPRAWYAANADNMRLHPNSRRLAEKMIGVIDAF